MRVHKPQSRKLKEASTKGESLTTAEAAALAGYARDHIGLMIRKGTLKGHKRGRDWFVEASSLYDYIQKKPRPGRKKY